MKRVARIVVEFVVISLVIPLILIAGIALVGKILDFLSSSSNAGAIIIGIGGAAALAHYFRAVLGRAIEIAEGKKRSR